MFAIVSADGWRLKAPLAVVPERAVSSGARELAPVEAEPRRRGPGEAGWWLRGAAVVLGLLAAASAAVSWQAQYVMVLGVKHAQVVAAVEAGIPDAGALIFAALGVAVALHGRRALRPRVLNAACVAVSLAMNALAARHGWRDLAIWVMPAAVYALASDTLIGVVRAQAVARLRADGPGFGDDAPDLLGALGGVALWLLRLVLAGPSTMRGFRAWVVEECPVAPGRKAGPGDQPRTTASFSPGPARELAPAPRAAAAYSGWGAVEAGSAGEPGGRAAGSGGHAAGGGVRAGGGAGPGRSGTARGRPGGSCFGMCVTCSPDPLRAGRPGGRLAPVSSYRSGQDDPNVAWALALGAVMASAVLVRWLAQVSVLALAGLVIGLVVAVIVARKAFSRKYLPGNRVRQMRLRARLRLRPGPGLATVFELHLRWGRLAAARRARRSRPSLSRADRLLCARGSPTPTSLPAFFPCGFATT